MDVSPNQLVSVSASLIPFLDHDDANRPSWVRTCNGRRALIQTRAPLVGTASRGVCQGQRRNHCRKSRSRRVRYATRIVIRVTEEEVEARMRRYIQAHQVQAIEPEYCITRTLVQQGDVVLKGQILADGPSTDHGELALGRNVMVAS